MPGHPLRSTQIMAEPPGLSGADHVQGQTANHLIVVALLACVGVATLAYSVLRSEFASVPTLTLRAARPSDAQSGRSIDQPPPPFLNGEAPKERLLGFGSRRVKIRPVGVKGPTVELYGVAFFLLFLSLQYVSSRADSERRARLRTYQFWLAVVGLAGVVWASYQISFRPRHLGPEHVVAALCLGALFVVSAGPATASAGEALRNLPRDAIWVSTKRAPWLALSVLLLIGLLQPTSAGPVRNRIPSGPEFLEWYKAQPRQPLLTPTDRQSVTLVEFTDYECPACRAAHLELSATIRRLANQFAPRFRYVVKDYPLDSSCNEFVKTNRHPNACNAAVAMRLARATGRAEPFLEWIWKNQQSLSADSLFDAAGKLAGVSNVMSRYENVLPEVVADIKLGHSLGVRGTPSFYLNGVQLSRLPVASLERAILYELESAGTSSGDRR